jgi:hypothetical protein
MVECVIAGGGGEICRRAYPWDSFPWTNYCRVQLKCDGTRSRTGGEVKGKQANGVGSHYSHTTSELGVSSITTVDAHNSAASSRLN